MSASLQKPEFPFRSTDTVAAPAEQKTTSQGFHEEDAWDFMSLAFPFVLALMGVAVALFPPRDDVIRFGWLAIFVMVAVAALMAAQGQREIYRRNRRRREAIASLRR
jgi:hypothetical protein